jgi:5S rRNA maturation endonuclease (ribonuclease M5)
MSRITLSESENRKYYESRVPKLKKSGSEYRAPCPLHGGTHPNLAVNMETGLWKCHSKCNRGGNIYKFEELLTGDHWRKAYRNVLAFVGRTPPPKNGSGKRIEVATYDYTDEHGKLLLQVVRYEGKEFEQRRPGGNGGWISNIKGVRRVLYRLPALLSASNVFVVEGEKDADALTELGVVATCNPMGAGKWRDEFSAFLRGKDIVIIPDADEKGRRHAADVQHSVERVAASVKTLELPNAKDAAEWIERGGTLEELVRLVESKPRQVAVTLGDVHDVFGKWMEVPDPGVITIALAAVAANMLDGDAVWVLLIGPPSSGKTEVLDSLLSLPRIFPAGTMSEAALLSGVAKRDHTAGASGGLLRSIADFGVLVAKDFGTVLAMSREPRSLLLAALREIFDGAWTRSVGTDGGKTLSWRGKCALLGGCTGVIDEHHGVMAAMGERFVLCRMPDVDPQKQAQRALSRIGQEAEMRKELRDVVTALFAGFKPGTFTLDDETRARLAALATLTARARSAVVRDGYKRDIELIPGSERPARLVLSLARLLHGMHAIGTADAEAWRLIQKIALDCLPDIRRRVLQYLQGRFEQTTTSVSVAIEYPTSTTRRVLEDLAAHGVVTRLAQGQGLADKWELSLFFMKLLRDARIE